MFRCPTALAKLKTSNFFESRVIASCLVSWKCKFLKLKFDNYDFGERSEEAFLLRIILSKLIVLPIIPTKNDCFSTLKSRIKSFLPNNSQYLRSIIPRRIN